VIRARLTVVEPALFEWGVFEMAAPIQSPVKCEVRSVQRFLNAEGERGVYWTIRRSVRTSRRRFLLVSSPKKHLDWKKFDDDDEVQEEVMTWFKGQAADFYDSGIQNLVPRLNK
jgi:hypothetical protein